MPSQLILICGPTATGKTRLGVALAKALGGEVVSADSMQVYRDLVIGTARPTQEEMAGVPHHMIAVAEPSEQWSAAEYVAKATPIVDDILSRGKLPILVGVVIGVLGMVMAAPALGPSLGVAPSGTWIWMSFFSKASSKIPKARARLRTTVRAVSTDSFITSPNCPVRSSSPFPGMMLTSI